MAKHYQLPLQIRKMGMTQHQQGQCFVKYKTCMSSALVKCKIHHNVLGFCKEQKYSSGVTIDCINKWDIL